MSRSTPPIHDIATFVAVAQHASFTRAAERLETSKSNVGKAVQRLEERLGTKLFQRTTRAVRLTEDGETYLDAARTALDSLGEAEVALSARRDEPTGRVRLDVPIGFGRVLLPTIATIRERYPKVTLDLSLSDRHSDAVGEGWDIVVRIGALPPGGDITVRKLCDIRQGLYASPAYVANHQSIKSVADLWNHEAIIFRGGAGQPRPWTVADGGQAVQMAPKVGLLVNDGHAMIDAALNGLGLAQIYDRVVQPFVAEGMLIHVLPEADDPRNVPVHALIPVGRRMPPKTRVVLEHLVEVLRAPLAGK